MGGFEEGPGIVVGGARRAAYNCIETEGEIGICQGAVEDLAAGDAGAGVPDGEQIHGSRVIGFALL